jgi:hypothetical protein
MKKLVGFVSAFTFVGLISLVGCSTGPDQSGTCPADCPSSDAGTDTAPVCTETVKGLSCAQLGVGNIATTCNGTKSFVCCAQKSGTEEFQDGTSCNAAPTCNVSAGQACSNVSLTACNNAFVCCVASSGAVQWQSGSSCSTTPPPVDSGTTPPVDSGPANPAPAGGSGAAATITIYGTVPVYGGKATDHAWVEGWYTTHADMRPDRQAQWLNTSTDPANPSKWSAFGASMGCDMYGGTSFVCTVPKPAGYDLRFQISVQRGSNTYWLCNTQTGTFDPGGSSYTVKLDSNTTPVVFTTSSSGAPWVNCDVGS